MLEARPKSKSKSKSPDESEVIRTPVTYNELRSKIIEEINVDFNTEKIEKIRYGSDYSISKLMKEVEKDFVIPNTLEGLENFNLGIGLIISKYMREFAVVSKQLDQTKHKLSVLEAKIEQEYKRNPDAHNNIKLEKAEIRNIILINPEHILLVEQVNNMQLVFDLFNKALNQIDKLSFHVSNAKDLLNKSSRAY